MSTILSHGLKVYVSQELYNCAESQCEADEINREVGCNLA